MTIAESCELPLSSDELPELERRIALVSTERLGWVGLGCAAWAEVFKSGWWKRFWFSNGGRDLLRLAVRTAEVDRLLERAGRDAERSSTAAVESLRILMGERDGERDAAAF